MRTDYENLKKSMDGWNKERPKTRVVNDVIDENSKYADLQICMRYWDDPYIDRYLNIQTKYRKINIVSQLKIGISVGLVIGFLVWLPLLLK